MLSPSVQAIFPITNIRRLRLWEEYFLRYDFTTYTLRGGRQVEDNATDHSPSMIVSQCNNLRIECEIYACRSSVQLEFLLLMENLQFSCSLIGTV